MYIFVLFSKTASRISLKLDGDVPWVDLYKVCTHGNANCPPSLAKKHCGGGPGSFGSALLMFFLTVFTFYMTVISLCVYFY